MRNDSTAVQNLKSFSDKLKTSHKTNKIKLDNKNNFIFDKSLCEDYKITRGYNLIDRFIDEIEFNFPIAYSILIYHHVEQIDRLLKFIWRPQNIYCFHIDSKSTDSFKKAVRSITNCFDNVFITEKSHKIVWGSFSILQAELDCMKDLMNSKTAWKYLIHMSGDEFPLKTNYELVKILSIYNGANDIDINYGLEFLDRTNFSYAVHKKELVRLDRIKDKPPHGYLIMKGHTNAALSRDFVNYILTDPKVKDLIEWSKDMRIPDEMYILIKSAILI